MSYKDDIFGIRPENQGDITTRHVARPTAFNPFDALGATAAAMTDAQVQAAWRRAHSHLLRAATRPLFPVAAELNAARDYLHVAATTPGGMATAIRTWAGSPRTFFAERDFGDATAFAAIAATAANGPTPLAASGGSQPRRRPATSPTDKAHRRKSARAATPSPDYNTAGATAANPYSIESDSDEEEEEPDDEHDKDFGAAATPGSAASATSNATGTPTATGRKPANRSSSSSARAAAAVMPNTSLEIMVGEWRQSTATPRNAVIARLDARGRLNFRVVARTLAGVPIAGPTATATSYPNIILSGNYSGMNYNVLRTTLIQQLSRHQQQLGN